MQPSPLSRRRLFQAAGAAALVGTGVGLGSPAAASTAVQFDNPLIQQRADPHITRHTDGYYYFTASVPAYDRIVMRRSATLRGLATAAETTVWHKHAGGPMSHHIWAPELHRAAGRRYLYFAAGRAEDARRPRLCGQDNAHGHRM